MPELIEPPGYHEVRSGEWLSKIATWYGFADWKPIWEHGNNSSLRASRKSPNVLFPGDQVYIPKREDKKENKSTNQLHRFALKRRLDKLRIRMVEYQDKPMKGLPYVLIVDGLQKFEGTTDGDGAFEHEISSEASAATLEINNQLIVLEIGDMDPHDTLTGTQARLSNLGYRLGAVDGKFDAETRRAIRHYQSDIQEAITGELDESIQKRLQDEHQS